MTNDKGRLRDENDQRHRLYEDGVPKRTYGGRVMSPRRVSQGEGEKRTEGWRLRGETQGQSSPNDSTYGQQRGDYNKRGY